MYIQNLQCNVKLLQEQQLLETRLQQVKNTIKNNENSCNHLGIVLGYIEHKSTEQEKKELYYTCKCILCNKALEAHKKKIDASTYKEDIYGHGANPEEINGRLNELQNLVSEYLSVNPLITYEEVIEKLTAEIKQDSKAPNQKKINNRK